MATVTLEVPDNLERKLQARADEEKRDVASVAIQIIEKALEQSPATISKQTLTGEEWLREFDAWVKSRPRIDVVLDDSRETIYEGR